MQILLEQQKNPTIILTDLLFFCKKNFSGCESYTSDGVELLGGLGSALLPGHSIAGHKHSEKAPRCRGWMARSSRAHVSPLPECVSLTFEEKRTFFTLLQLTFYKSHSEDRCSPCIIPGKALLLGCGYDARCIPSPGDSVCSLGYSTVGAEVVSAFNIVMVNLAVLAMSPQVC